MYILSKNGHQLGKYKNLNELKTFMYDVVKGKSFGTTKQLVIDRLKKDADLDSHSGEYGTKVLQDPVRFATAFKNLVSDNTISDFEINKKYQNVDGDVVLFRIQTQKEKEAEEAYANNIRDIGIAKKEEDVVGTVYYNLYVADKPDDVDEDEIQEDPVWKKLQKSQTLKAIIKTWPPLFGLDVTEDDVKFNHVYSTNERLIKFTKEVASDDWYILFMVLQTTTGKEIFQPKAKTQDVDKMVKKLYEFGIHLKSEELISGAKNNKVYDIPNDPNTKVCVKISKTTPDMRQSTANSPAVVKKDKEHTTEPKKQDTRRTPESIAARDARRAEKATTTTVTDLLTKINGERYFVKSSMNIYGSKTLEEIPNMNTDSVTIKKILENHKVTYWVLFNKIPIVVKDDNGKWWYNPYQDEVPVMMLLKHTYNPTKLFTPDNGNS